MRLAPDALFLYNIVPLLHMPSFHTHTACDAFSFQAKNLLDKMLLRVLYKQYNASIHLRLNMFVSHTSQAFYNGIVSLIFLQSIKTQTLLKKQMICTYDEFPTNTKFNQIIKSTMLLLLKANITNTRKKSLRNLLLFFSDVNEIDLRFVNWNQHYNRSNQSYQMLIGICYLIYNGLLQTQTDGTTKIMDFFDEQRMCHLYEKFLLEYYRKEHT